LTDRNFDYAVTVRTDWTDKLLQPCRRQI